LRFDLLLNDFRAFWCENAEPYLAQAPYSEAAALNVDDEALTGAMKASPGKTKTDVINEALREYARRRRLQEFLEFEGKMHWEGDLDQLRGRSHEL